MTDLATEVPRVRVALPTRHRADSGRVDPYALGLIVSALLT